MATAYHNLSDYDSPLYRRFSNAFWNCCLRMEQQYNWRIIGRCGKNIEKAWCKRRKHTCTNIPGSFELTFGSAQMIKSGKVDAVIALGCVVRGDTPHFDYVCAGATQGITQLNATTDIPVIYGLITTNNMEQAEERAGGKLGNKGDECAITAIKMIDFVCKLKK